MGRPPKPHHSIAIRLEQNLYDKFIKFCDDSGQSRTVAVERALESYLEEYYRKQDVIEKNM